MAEYLRSGERGEFPANSRQILALGIRLQAAETLLRQIWPRRDAKVSRGAFGGQHFGDGDSEASRSNLRKLTLLPLKPEQLALFGPVGGEFEG